MPVTGWFPQVVMRPVLGGFKPAALATKYAAQQLAPKKTGRLAKGTSVKFTGATSAVLVNRVPYIYPVTGGQRAHEIGPRNKQAVVTPKGVFAHVQHPGAQGNPFLNKAATGFSIAYAFEVSRRWR